MEVVRLITQLCDGASLGLLTQAAPAMFRERPTLRKALLGTTECQLCAGPIKNPHRLADCGHVACGSCLHMAIHGTVPSRASWRPWRCSQDRCGTVAVHRPQSLSNAACKAAASAARFILDRRDFHAWQAQATNARTFEAFGFPGDYGDEDECPSRGLESLAWLPSEHMYRISHCSAAVNFSGFPIGSGSLHREALADTIRDYFRDPDQADMVYDEAACYDIVLVESDGAGLSENDDDGFDQSWTGAPSVIVKVSDWTQALPCHDEEVVPLLVD